MFVALREFVDLVKKTENSSVTKNMPYAVIIGNFVNNYTSVSSINTDFFKFYHLCIYAKGKFYR